MKVKINANLFKEEIVEIGEWETEGLSKEERRECIDRAIWEYTRSRIEYKWTIVEE